MPRRGLTGALLAPPPIARSRGRPRPSAADPAACSRKEAKAGSPPLGAPKRHRRTPAEARGQPNGQPHRDRNQHHHERDCIHARIIAAATDSEARARRQAARTRPSSPHLAAPRTGPNHVPTRQVDRPSSVGAPHPRPNWADPLTEVGHDSAQFEDSRRRRHEHRGWCFGIAGRGASGRWRRGAMPGANAAFRSHRSPGCAPSPPLMPARNSAGESAAATSPACSRRDGSPGGHDAGFGSGGASTAIGCW
jgi:hypothetical protein